MTSVKNLSERIGNGYQRNRASIMGLMTAAYCYAVTAMPALADTAAITNGIVSGTGKIWDILKAIVAPIAAIALAICAVKMLWGSQRAAEEAKSTAIKIIIAIAIVFLAPSIVTALR